MRHNHQATKICWSAAALFALCVVTGPIAVGAVAADGGSGSFKPIFDGKTLDGWDGDPQFWRVEDGAITGETTAEKPAPSNTFIVWRQGKVDDFELRLQFRLTGHNSGIQIRSQELHRWKVVGYQCDMEVGPNWTGAVYDEEGRGPLAPRGKSTVIDADGQIHATAIGDPDELLAKVKPGEWNDYHVTARGNKISIEINGVLMSKVVDNQTSEAERSGVLALQIHTGTPMKVQFRNIALKRLPLVDQKKIVFLAGTPSHGYGAHEHNAGCLLLSERLEAAVPSILTQVYLNGWPADPTALVNADAIVMYCDGGEKHMVNDHLAQVDALSKRGVGIACLHYGVEVPKGEPGDRFLDWIGGYFETYFSVNPHWTAEFKSFPDHPVTRGVEPFTILDEWYYHMRFRDGMQGVTPVLSALPPENTRTDRWGYHHGGNEFVAAAKGQLEHVAWVSERPGGGRGFGFTGGHFHANWQNDNFRKLALNAIAWVAGVEIPPGGIDTPTPTDAEIEANQDYPKPTAEEAQQRAARRASN